MSGLKIFKVVIWAHLTLTDPSRHPVERTTQEIINNCLELLFGYKILGALDYYRCRHLEWTVTIILYQNLIMMTGLLTVNPKRNSVPRIVCSCPEKYEYTTTFMRPENTPKNELPNKNHFLLQGKLCGMFFRIAKEYLSFRVFVHDWPTKSFCSFLFANIQRLSLFDPRQQLFAFSTKTTSIFIFLNTFWDFFVMMKISIIQENLIFRISLFRLSLTF